MMVRFSPTDHISSIRCDAVRPDADRSKVSKPWIAAKIRTERPKGN